MSERDQAIANRDRIGRLYGFTGKYGTTSGPSASEEPLDIEPKIEKIEEEEINMSTELVFNRFRPASVAGRILTALAAGPKTPAQLAHLAGSRSADNIVAPGGWFFQLRKFGKTSGKFKLEKDGNKLILQVSKRYAKQV